MEGCITPAQPDGCSRLYYTARLPARPPWPAAILVWEDVWQLPNNAALTGWLLSLITAGGCVLSQVMFWRRCCCRGESCLSCCPSMPPAPAGPSAVSPPRTIAFLFPISAAAGAVVCGVLFPRRFWCRHLCPIGGMNSLFAKVSATKLRSQAGVCSGGRAGGGSASASVGERCWGAAPGANAAAQAPSRACSLLACTSLLLCPHPRSSPPLLTRPYPRPPPIKRSRVHILLLPEGCTGRAAACLRAIWMPHGLPLQQPER